LLRDHRSGLRSSVTDALTKSGDHSQALGFEAHQAKPFVGRAVGQTSSHPRRLARPASTHHAATLHSSPAAKPAGDSPRRRLTTITPRREVSHGHHCAFLFRREILKMSKKWEGLELILPGSHRWEVFRVQEV
jgi:hypothetical protein